MKIEKLKSNYTKKVLIGLVVVIIAVVSFIMGRSQAKYKQTQDMKLVEGTISYKLADMNLVAMYQKDNSDYYSVSAVPTSGYTLNTTESYCEASGSRVDVTIELKSDGVYFGKVMNAGTKCYLYFDKIYFKTMDEILAGYSIGSRGSFSTPYTTSTTKTIFTAQDDYGTSKYFAGAPTDNYVKFGGFYWRIIRMNGDKTTRLIYVGKASVIDGLSNKQTVLANGYDDNSTKYTKIKENAFNSSYDNNVYVGFKYEIGVLRGTTNKSAILTELDTWYETNLKTNYGKYIDGSTGFCGDRTAYTDTTGTTIGGETGRTVTYYGDYIRLRTNKNPVLTCANSSDLYTTSEASRGNKALINPIGLINANEVAMAGAKYGTDNTSYYLRTNSYYWTMSPSVYSNGAAVFYVDTAGALTGDRGNLNNPFGVRPTINLASNVRFDGSGTWNDPFVVVET